METIQIKYFTDKIEKLSYIGGKSDWIDLRAAQTVHFNKGISEYIDQPFRFHCLNDNVATLMAIANDIGYEEVFRFQLRGNLEQSDILIAISGSGNSKNILNAVEYTKLQGNKVIGITGYDGGKLKELCDISLHAPVMSMQVTEDVHMIFDHLMMSMFYRYLCGKEHLEL